MGWGTHNEVAYDPILGRARDLTGEELQARHEAYEQERDAYARAAQKNPRRWPWLAMVAMASTQAEWSDWSI